MNDTNFSSGVVWSYIQSWIARAITTVGFLIIGWYLGPVEFGIFSVVATTILLAEMLCEQSFSQTVIQLKNIDDSRLTSIFMLALACGLIFSCALALSANAIGQYFSEPALGPLLRVAAICPALIGLTAVPIGLLRKEMAFKVLAKRTVLSSAVSSFAGIALVIYGMGAWGLVIQAVLYYAIGLVVIWRNCNWRPVWTGNFFGWPDILKLVYWNSATKISDFAETRGLEVMIGSFMGMHALGIYAFASKLAQTAFQILSSPILEVIFADVARQSEAHTVAKSVRNGQLIVATLPTGLLFGLGCVAAPLLTTLYGDRWTESARPLAILAFAFVVRGLLYVLGSALLALGTAGTAVKLSTLRAVLSVLFCYMALSLNTGMEGVAWAYLFSALIVSPMSSLALSRILSIPCKGINEIPVKAAFSICLAAVLFMGANAIEAGPVITMLVSVVASLLYLIFIIAANAGLIVSNIAQFRKDGLVGRMMKIIYRTAAALLYTRERVLRSLSK